MPSAWSKKDERQYEHIVAGCTRPKKVCKRIAAATVNKRRRLEGRTLNGFSTDAKEAIQRNPDYFVWWYTAKSVALCAAVAGIAYLVGKNQAKVT